MFNSRLIISIWSCAGISVGAAFASPSIPVVTPTNNIFVNNPSFETPAGPFAVGGCGAGCSYNYGPIDGWTINPGGGGQFQPGFDANNFAYFFNGSSDGTPTNAYSNGGTISQMVGTVGDVGTVYTLAVDIGHRNDLPAAGSVNLVINGVSYAAIGTYADSGLWSTFTATHTATLADVGSNIEIDLNASGSQGNFDNVILSATPEPGFYGLLTLGLSGIAVVVNRRRKA